MFVLIILAIIVVIMTRPSCSSVLFFVYVFSGPVSMIIAWQKRRAQRRAGLLPEENRGHG